MTDHTRTPWAADPDWREGLSWNIHIVDAANRDMRICFMTSDGPAEANAAFIVKAVNAHDELVKALEQIDAVAVSKKAGSLVRMQRIARNALTSIKVPA